MRSKVPITIGDPKASSNYATIKYNDFLQAYVLIFYQYSNNSEDFHVVRKATSKKLSEALSAAIDWADEGNEVIRFRNEREIVNRGERAK